MRYKLGAKTRVGTFGDAGKIGLADARTKAFAWHAIIGRDPAAEERRKAAAERRLPSVVAFAREYIERARRIVPIVTVQNRYSFADREWDFVVDYCEQNNIGFMPWAPMAQQRFAHQALERAAHSLNATPLQVALAWLLKRSKVILPIPGTSSVAHVEQNIAAAGLELPQRLYDELSALSHPAKSLRG